MDKIAMTFQVDSDIVNSSRAEANYVVEINDSAAAGNLCVIYFTSNALYYPNTEASFTKSVIEKDYYEWRSNVPITAFKQIFVRDIYKQWYLQGINNQIITPPICSNC